MPIDTAGLPPKICNGCGAFLGAENFYGFRAKSGNIILNSRCKPCNAEYAKEFYVKHKDRLCKKYTDKFRSDPEFKSKELARKRSKYATDPEYRSRHLALSERIRRRRFETDPAYRERCKKQNHVYHIENREAITARHRKNRIKLKEPVQ